MDSLQCFIASQMLILVRLKTWHTHISVCMCACVCVCASYHVTLYCNIATIVYCCFQTIPIKIWSFFFFFFREFMFLFFFFHGISTTLFALNCCWAEEVCERAPSSYWEELKEVVLVADGNVEWSRHNPDLWKSSNVEPSQRGLMETADTLEASLSFPELEMGSCSLALAPCNRPSCIPQEPTGLLPSNGQSSNKWLRVCIWDELKQHLPCVIF